MHSLARAIETASSIQTNPQGQDVRTIRDRDLIAIGKNHRTTIYEVFIQCLKMGITPLRYLRNQPSISLDEQLILAESEVAVVGCGGLGGHVVHLLARLGVGRLLLFDPDRFDETNLNRQIFCSTDHPETYKVHEATRHCSVINPAVDVLPYVLAVTGPEQKNLLSRTHAVVDALDNAPDRRSLAELAGQLNIPMIHGAVAGFEGRLMIVWPGDTGLDMLYAPDGQEAVERLSAETLLGTPALAPSLIATYQAMAVVNVLLKRTPVIRNRLIHADLTHPSLDVFTL